LNSAEAVFASLLILGQDEQANLFRPRFNWAPEFERINAEVLGMYRSAKDSADIERIQDEYIETITAPRKTDGSS
ncbi:MAG: DUF367 domain-containing protein, partial [Candidatus Methanomethylophilus sp.]|nr:DUF367 domain-containing protein [Methanomethylophilus sp.]